MALGMIGRTRVAAMPRIWRAITLAIGFVIGATFVSAMEAEAAELRVFTTGAAKQVVQSVADAHSARTGAKITIMQDTAGGLRRRVEAGEEAHVLVATPEVLTALAAGGRAVGASRVDFARTGVGVGVRAGAAKPDISSVEAIKALLASAPSIALPDPRAGGTSALFLEGLFKRLGVAEMVAAKARLKAGGYAAELVATGEAEVVLHQISEIRPVKGVELVGPLPAEIQLITTYSAALASGAAADPAALAFLAALAGADGRSAAEAAGMDPLR